MKTLPALLILLTLGFGSAQAVSWADCCCGSFCEHKNSCTGCGPEDDCRGGATASCCEQEESLPEKTCAHLEPSSEIETGSVDGPDLAPEGTEPAWSIDPVLPAPPPSPAPAPVDTGPPRAIPLLRSVLRI